MAIRKTSAHLTIVMVSEVPGYSSLEEHIPEMEDPDSQPRRNPSRHFELSG